jgi:gliding motility-associated-like protein
MKRSIASHHMFFLHCCCLFFLGGGNSYSQGLSGGFVTSSDLFGGRCFVENKGQYRDVEGEKVLFALDNGMEKIFFTGKGLFYEMLGKVDQEEWERVEHGDRSGAGKLVPKRTVSMTWQDASTPSVTPSDKVRHYFTFGAAGLNSAGYRRLLFHGLYEGIDIEYLIPPGSLAGIKYNVHLHPGADVSVLKFRYGHDATATRLREDGSVLVESDLDSIIEHAPQSFDDTGQPVATSFGLNDGLLSFFFTGQAAPSRKIVIDPYVVTTNTLTSNGHAYDVDYDANGNTFVFGGVNPCKVASYDAFGNLNWVFGGTVPMFNWSSTPVLPDCPGNFIVQRPSGKIYIGQGFNYLGTQVVRIDNAGNFDNFIGDTTALYEEVWDMGFYCPTGELFVLGGTTSSNLSAAKMSTVTGLMTLSGFQPFNNDHFQDIISGAIDQTGEVFILYGTGVAQNTLNGCISRINPTFNGAMFTQATNLADFQEGNKHKYVGIPTLNSVGYNALAVSNNFLYCYNGRDLAVYNKLSGIMHASVSIPGLNTKEQGGIVVDDCNNVYVGGNGLIHCFNFSGISFTALQTISLNLSGPLQYVYDIKLNRAAKVLYVSGSGFVGNYPAIHTFTCSMTTSSCDVNQAGFTVQSSSITCSSLGSATCTPFGFGAMSFTWLPGNITGPVATGLIPGQYTIVCFDSTANYSYSSTVYFAPLVPLNATVSATPSLACHGAATGSVGVTGLSGGSANQHYVWTHGNQTYSTASITSLTAGNYFLLITDALTGCIFYSVVAIQQPPAPTLQVAAVTPTACAGNKTGLLAFMNGGTPGYTYTWSNAAGGPTTSVTGQAGIQQFSVTVTDANGCQIVGTRTLNFLPLPNLIANDVWLCPSQSGTVSVSGANTYTWNTGSNAASFVVSPSASVIYTVVGTGSVCTSAKVVSVTIKSVPVPTVSSNGALCAGQTLSLFASGGNSYSWTGPLGYLSQQSQPAIVSASVANSGIYQVTVTAANSCTASATTGSTVYPVPVLSVTGSTVCETENSVLQFTSSINPVQVSWSGPNGYTSQQHQPAFFNTSPQMSGIYHLNVTDTNGCTATAMAHLTVSPAPQLTLTSTMPACETGTLGLFASGALPGTGFLWSGPLSFTSLAQDPQLFSLSPGSGGVYTLNASYGPCQQSQTISITVHPAPSISISATKACENHSVQLVATAANTYTWNWNGPLGIASSGNVLTILYARPAFSGVYTVTGQNPHGCASSETMNLKVNANPVLTAETATACLNQPVMLEAGGAANYHWQGPGWTSALSSPTLIATIPGTTHYTVTGTALTSCSSQAVVALQTYTLPVASMEVIPGNDLCPGQTVTLKGSGGQLYEWAGPGQKVTSGLLTFEMTSARAGVYSLTCINEKGCRSTIDSLIRIKVVPYAELDGNNSGCVPLCATFSLQTPEPARFTSRWNVEGGRNENTFYHCFRSPGKFTIQGMIRDSITGCSSSSRLDVTVHAKPEALFSFVPEHPVEAEGEVVFTAEGPVVLDYNWYFDTQKSSSAGKRQTMRYDNSGMYTIALLVRNQWGCSDSTVRSLFVEPDFQVFVPNVFTPNGDDRNNTFRPVMRGWTTYSMQIFNRWGEMLFESKDPEQGWNGEHRERECPQGVYVYKITAGNGRNAPKTISGHLTLMR